MADAWPPYSAYTRSLEQLAAEAIEGRPVWSRPDLHKIGLPFRTSERPKPFQGVNVLTLWMATPRRSPPLRWASDGSGHGAPVIAFNNTDEECAPPDGPYFANAHLVVPSPDVSRIVDREALSQALKSKSTRHKALRGRLEVLVDARQRAHQRWTDPPRSALHTKLRRSMGVDDAEELLREITLALLAARLGVRCQPAPTCWPVTSRQLPWAASVAWRLHLGVISVLRSAGAFAVVRPRPQATVAAKPKPLSERRRLELAAEALEAIVKHTAGSTHLGVMAIHARLKLVVDGHYRHAAIQRIARSLLDVDPSVQSTPPADLALLPEVLEALLAGRRPNSGPGAASAGEQLALVFDTEPADSPFRAISDRWKAVGDELRRALVDRESRDTAESRWGLTEIAAWRGFHARHTRCTWLHHLNELDAAGIAATGLPVDALGVEAKGPDTPTGLADVGGLIGRPVGHPIDEEATRRRLVQATSPSRNAPRPKQNRRVNRNLRRDAARGGPLTDAAEFPRTPHESWPALAARLMHGPDAAYQEAWIPKRGGGARRLMVPAPALADAQRLLGSLLARHFGASAAMAAFHPHRSAAWHARMHEGARQAIVMDIRDFFGAVRARHFNPCFQGRVYRRETRRVPAIPFLRWSDEGRDAVRALLFVPADDGKPEYLAQGAPSSPIVANLAAARLDRMVGDAMAKRFGRGAVRYSRYADDLVVSVAQEQRGFLDTAERVVAGCIRAQGWKPNRKKTRRWRRGAHPLVIVGIRVPEQIGGALTFPRSVRRRVRAALHRVKAAAPVEHPDPRDAGLLAYAYAVTGDSSLIAWQSVGLRHLALEMAGPCFAVDFLEGWAST